MDRIINIEVNGNYVSKDNKNAGVRGEANVTKLRITFDESWDKYAKTVTFFDAYGNNPVKRVQTVDLIEDIVNDTKTYITPIPKEPLAIAGEMTFIIDGYIDGKRKRSVKDTLIVEDAPDVDNAEEPTDPTATPYEDLQQQIDAIVPDIQAAIIAGQNATSSEANAKIHSDNAKLHSDNAKLFSNDAYTYAETAARAVDKVAYIGGNGNWFAWDGVQETFYDTGVKAQAGSEVYVGENPPESADVWINPNGAIEDVMGKLAALQEKVDLLYAKSLVKTVTINLLASAWVEDGSNQYSQVVVIADITPYSKVDLQPTTEQLLIFYEKDIAFVTENDDGVVTVYCIGQKPTLDYAMQATITEVEKDG